MAENSKIEWTDHTFNPWEGCTKVSPGCAHCYAETRAERFGSVKWGPSGTRRVASGAYWKQPLKWNRDAERAGVRRRVFCASLADVFEDWRGPMTDSQGQTLFTFGRGACPWTPATGSPPPGQRPLTMGDVRLRLFDLIRQTPHLDWLLLTKRPENVTRWIADAMNIAWGVPQKETPLAQWVENWLTHHAVPTNVWLGTSVENQAAADARIHHLLLSPAPVHFLSCEPLLGDTTIKPYLPHKFNREPHCDWCEECIPFTGGADWWKHTRADRHGPFVDWVIVGGESGPGARPMQIEWARSIVTQCKAASVPVFVKQLGAHPEFTETAVVNPWRADGPKPHRFALALKDKKGGDPEEWPADLRVREFPTV